MYTHEDLARLQAQSLKMQSWIRQQTFSPENIKTLRRFSSWEVSELIFQINQSTFRGRLAAEPDLPGGEVEPDGRQRWFSLDEINELRRKMKINRKTLMPPRPAGKRAFRAAVANFKGGAGKSTVALHLAHAAALDGYRVLVVDFDPQATLSHSMGLTDVAEDYTVWGIMARDLIRETDRMNAAFVEFASAQYRHLNPEWSFFAAVSRYLDGLGDDDYDLILFDCPPAIGYQSMNAVFAADMLYIPSGPGYWEYDSTTSFIGQLAEALEDLSGFGATFPAGKISLPKAFADVRFLMTRYEPGNDLHRAMFEAFRKVFGEHVAEHPIEMTRAVEQSGRFLSSVYEIDYREMTRETWRRARASFDRAYEEFKGSVIAAWDRI